MAKEDGKAATAKRKRKQCEKELRRLQAELYHRQEWVNLKGLIASSCTILRDAKEYSG